MASQITLRVFTYGGIVSLDDLQHIMHIARECGCASITPGFRQELYLQIEEKYLTTAKDELDKYGVAYATDKDSLHNIVTSFVALDIFPSTTWLMGDTYLDILDSFTYQPGLQINIVDPLQNLVPLFTGELNFIASAYPRYWYLCLNFPGFGKRQVWPTLIDGDDIGSLCRLIEEIYSTAQPETIHELFASVTSKFTGRSRSWQQELQLSSYVFPVLEGLHQTGDTYWLGIYRRNYTFDLAWLGPITQLCLDTKIGNICFTSYKTMVIKGIREEDCLQWKKLLGLHSLSTQHAALELNWQLPDLDNEAIQLKKTWVAEMEEKEVCTAGMSFAIQTTPIEAATSVLIDRKPNEGGGEEKYLYRILHTIDFSPHTVQWQVFAEYVSRYNVGSALLQLCQVYYQQIGTILTNNETEEIPLIKQSHSIYQCRNCLTVYDPIYGDVSSGIIADTTFEELPETYTCSLCEAPKADFILVESIQYI